ncbi:USP [Symbiodinium sp. CCMP2592]|nr:USP [Symbiodinium sp. CCMP2592]
MATTADISGVAGLAENRDVLGEENCACAARLVAAGQAAIFGTWDPPGTCDAEKLQFFDQIRTLDKNYPGGLGSYLRNALTLLQASAGGENPLDGWVPSVPQDGFQPEVGSAEFLAYEEFGAKEVSKCCFVIPAGGLGERLGFSGVKFALPAELVTGSCVLGVYCAYLRAFQDLSEASAKQPCRLPLVIMASADTDAGIRELLARGLAQALVLCT